MPLDGEAGLDRCRFDDFDAFRNDFQPDIVAKHNSDFQFLFLHSLSTLIPASAMSRRQVSISFFSHARASSAVLSIGAIMPAFSKLAFISGVCAAAVNASCSLSMISRGTPAGAKAADHCDGRKPGKPTSAMVGTSGHA